MPSSPETDPAEIAADALERLPADALAPYEGPDTTRDLPARVSRNVRWNLWGQLWTLGVTLVATPIIITRLGADAYGVIAALAIVTNYAAFLDLGVSQASVKHVAEHRSENRWDLVHLVFWTSIALYVALGLIASALFFGLSPAAVSRWFRIPAALQGEAVLAFWVGAAGVFLVLLNFGPTALIKGLERFDLANKVGIGIGTVQPVLTLGLVLAGASLPVIVAGNVAVLAGTVAINFGIARSLFPRLGRPQWDQAVFLRLLRFGGYLAAASVLAPLVLTSEKLLLAGRVSIAALTYYMVPQSLLARLAIIPASFSSALFPAFTALHTSGDRRKNVELNSEVARTMVYVFGPILVVMLLAGRSLLALWMGADFARESGAVLEILSVAAFVHSLAWTPHVLIQALGRSDITFRVYLYQVLLYVPVAYVLVDRWALIGAAVAWLVRVILDSGLVWYYARSLGGASLRQVAAGGQIRGAFAGMCLLVLGRLLGMGFPAAGMVVAVVGAAVTIGCVTGPLTAAVRRVAAGEIGHEAGSRGG